MKKIAILFSFLLLITFSINIENKSSYAFSVSKGEIVLEQSTKRVLYENNADLKLPMASTTKIITCITAIENADLDDEVKVTSKTCNIEGSSIYLKDGDIYSLRDLLYGLMLRSGNDCAETIALFVGKGRDNFINLMNETAKKCGANNTNLTNPHGLPDKNHYTTARDLALISCYAMDNPVFNEIVSSKSAKIVEKSTGNERVIVNKNKMLTRFDGANGIKTGFTKLAGRCLVSSAKRQNMQLVCVTLNCPQMFERSSELLNSCFNRFSLKEILLKEDFRKKTCVRGAEKSEFCLQIKNDVLLPLKENEEVTIEIKLPEKILLPKKRNEIVGEIEFYIKNNLIFSQKIYTMESIDSMTYWDLIKIIAKNF